ncbi:DUF3219 family protein [Alkalihalobacillus pseudalcaliphilus]|uniref:DUF3219 family protein n=1 Tax=Alkalihalobacillus pseudalcaliphilus TaxID=79884 RepID=UPI00064E02DF|nr:DUF3219 family protein [Alkalihalobacillus pseudalcaliphilus]KMK78106.1 hypothetical protein AB990_01265 [Alkalihalobacillus pseudalcaliphilus]
MLVKLNDYELVISSYQLGLDKGLKVVILDFNVTHEDYHSVTTLLYQNQFELVIPDESLHMKVSIHNYSTSFTNLYKEGEVGQFHLELKEIDRSI